MNGMITVAIVLIVTVISQIPFFLFLVIIVGCWAAYTLTLRRATVTDIDRGGAVPGIYKWGLEMPIYPIYMTRLFIPWNEIEGIWVKRSIVASDTVYISVHKSRWKWRFPKVLMGDEGLTLAEALVGTSRPIPPEPEVGSPRLVLYTSEGVSQESHPEGP